MKYLNKKYLALKEMLLLYKSVTHTPPDPYAKKPKSVLLLCVTLRWSSSRRHTVHTRLGCFDELQDLSFSQVTLVLKIASITRYSAHSVVKL